jgi:hypothetical protein
MGIIQGKLNKQFDVIMCDILNKCINSPTSVLPLKDVYEENLMYLGLVHCIFPHLRVHKIY